MSRAWSLVSPSLCGTPGSLQVLRLWDQENTSFEALVRLVLRGVLILGSPARTETRDRSEACPSDLSVPPPCQPQNAGLKCPISPQEAHKEVTVCPYHLISRDRLFLNLEAPFGYLKSSPVRSDLLSNSIIGCKKHSKPLDTKFLYCGWSWPYLQG